MVSLNRNKLHGYIFLHLSEVRLYLNNYGVVFLASHQKALTEQML